MEIIQKKLDNGHTISVEVSSASKNEGKVGKGKEAAELFDEAFDKLIQNEITEYCSILVGAFENLNKLIKSFIK